MDAVEYLINALEAYRALDPTGQKQLLAEVAALGQRGLAINDPDQKHQLRHYRGGSTVSALQGPASTTPVCSCYCLGRIRGWIWRGSMGWRGGWWGVGSEQLGLEWKALMEVLTGMAAVGQGGLQIRRPAPPAPSSPCLAAGVIWPRPV
jgi:hypothetical protein